MDRRETREKKKSTILSCSEGVRFHVSPDTFNPRWADVIMAKLCDAKRTSRGWRYANGGENFHQSLNKQVNWLMNDASSLMWGFFINIHYTLMYTAVNWWAILKITPTTTKVFVCLRKIRKDKGVGGGSANQELRKWRWNRVEALNRGLTLFNSSHELLQVQ